MSVWQNSLSATPALTGSEGALVSVSIDLAPRHLESLLEALAEVDFPINPQIYHDAVVVYRFADGHETSETVTLVEFPAYAGRLDEVRRALEAHGFDPASAHVAGMLDEIHSECRAEPAPAGAPYATRYWRKSRAAGAVH